MDAYIQNRHKNVFWSKFSPKLGNAKQDGTKFLYFTYREYKFQIPRHDVAVTVLYFQNVLLYKTSLKS